MPHHLREPLLTTAGFLFGFGIEATWEFSLWHYRCYRTQVPLFIKHLLCARHHVKQPFLFPGSEEEPFHFTDEGLSSRNLALP